MDLKTFLNTLAIKAGKQNEQAIIDLLANANLANINIPDDVANAIDSSLLTIDSAKNNPALKSHFTATALAGVDTELLNVAKSLELGDDFITELTGEKNTYAKPGKLAAKFKIAMEGLKNAKKDGEPKDIEKYTNQINDLNSQLSQLKETHIPKSELDALKKTHESELTNYIVRNMLTGKKYANADLPVDVNVLTAQTLINQALAAKKAAMVNDGGVLKLKRADDMNLDYYDEQNKPVDFAGFVDSVLSQSKMLAVSDPTKGGKTIVAPVVPGTQPDTTNVTAATADALANLR